jgi:sulfur carrier protein ThiS adenylyltransferase
VTEATVNLADRDLRQRDLVPPTALARCHAVVIGVGAVGRQVSLQLAATGVPALTLYDPDTVGVENLAVQGFWESDLGARKVDAVASVCHQQCPRLEVHTRPERFRKSAVRDWPVNRDLAIFCCVDSIAARKLIWEAVRSRATFFADGRMAAEVIRVLASDRPARDAAYAMTLFAAGEAYAGSCTAKSTLYAASIAAGLMIGQFARWLRRLPVVSDQTLNLLATELTVSEPVD